MQLYTAIVLAMALSATISTAAAEEAEIIPITKVSPPASSTSTSQRDPSDYDYISDIGQPLQFQENLEPIPPPTKAPLKTRIANKIASAVSTIKGSFKKLFSWR